MKAEEIVKISVNALNGKKALQLNALKISELTVLTEYFVLATATSATHVRALADEVEEKLGEAGLTPEHIEGRSTGWIVIDYGSVIVHIFNREQREFYALDNMWADGESVDLNTILVNEKEDAV